jgi:hypothetical protein
MSNKEISSACNGSFVVITEVALFVPNKANKSRRIIFPNNFKKKKNAIYERKHYKNNRKILYFH